MDKETVLEEMPVDAGPDAGANSFEDASADGVQVKKKERKKSAKEQKLADELSQASDRLLRLTAEYDNYRKRTEKEKQSLISYGISLSVERLLPVLDTLEMAAAAKTDDLEYKKGVELTAAMYRTALSSLGVEEIEAEGKQFDPTKHNCVASEENGGVESGTVIRVMQKGYRIGERVIRPAMVAVAS